MMKEGVGFGAFCWALLVVPGLAAQTPVDFDGIRKGMSPAHPVSVVQVGNQAPVVEPVSSAIQAFKCQERAAAPEPEGTVVRRTRRVLGKEEVEDVINLYLRGMLAAQGATDQRLLSSTVEAKMGMLSSSGSGGTRVYYEQEETEETITSVDGSIKKKICILFWKVYCKISCTGTEYPKECFEDCMRILVNKKCRTEGS